MPGDGSEVADDENDVVHGPPHSQKRQDALLGIVAVYPFEPGRVEIELVQSWLPPVHGVRLLHPAGEPRVRGILEEVPVEAAVVVPLPPLAEFPPHEEELLPGLPVHVPVEGPQVGELLPGVPGHLADERPLAVDDLVMREGENEVFREGVHQTEG